jgi:hypothetical protein
MAMNSSFPTDRPGSNTAFVFSAADGSPVERGQPVFSSRLAAGFVKMEEMIFETDEDDEYYKMLTLFGRSEDDDQRIAVHESGHAVAARLLGNPLGGATINPDPNGKYGGLVWGPGYSVAYGDDDGGDRVSELCDKLRSAMPRGWRASRRCCRHLFACAQSLHRTRRCGERRAHAFAGRPSAECQRC